MLRCSVPYEDSRAVPREPLEARGSRFATPLLLFEAVFLPAFPFRYPRRTFCILRAATLASSSESDSLWEVELWEAELQGEEHSGEHR